MMMHSAQILKALERERQLLEDFICLSEEQLLLLEAENIEGVNSLLKRRAELMMELTAIEATLGTWIWQIRTDASVTPDMMRELRSVNDEIVSMANHIVEIDEQTHERLELIKQRAQRQLQQLDRGGRALQVYAQACTIEPSLHKEGPHF
jgi:TolA-binding protein